MKRFRLLIIGLVLIAAFALFSRSIKRGAMQEIDFAVTVKVQEKIDTSSRLRLARATGELMEGSSFFASPGVSITVIIIITIITVIKKRKISPLLIPIAFLLMTLAEIYGKSVVHHPAPPFFLLKNPTTVFPNYYVWEEFSYPSGHAARSLFLAIVLFFLFKKRPWTIFALGMYVGLISSSRIYLGHHWLSDVIGGWILGGGTGLLTSVVLLPYNNNRHEGLA